MKYKRKDITDYTEQTNVNGTAFIIDALGVMYRKINRSIKSIASRPAEKFTVDIPTKAKVSLAIAILDAPTVSTYKDGAWVYLRDNILSSDLTARANNMLNSTRYTDLVLRLHELADNGFTASFYVTERLCLYAIRENETGKYLPYSEIYKDPILKEHLVDALLIEDNKYSDLYEHEDVAGYVLDTSKGYYRLLTKRYVEKLAYDVNNLSDKEIAQMIMNDEEHILFRHNPNNSRVLSLGIKLTSYVSRDYYGAVGIYRESKQYGLDKHSFIYKRCNDLKIPHMSSIIFNIKNDKEAADMIFDVYRFFLNTLK